MITLHTNNAFNVACADARALAYDLKEPVSVIVGYDDYDRLAYGVLPVSELTTATHKLFTAVPESAVLNG